MSYFDLGLKYSSQVLFYMFSYGALTQLARVLVLHTRGHRFESDMFQIMGRRWQGAVPPLQGELESSTLFTLFYRGLSPHSDKVLKE